MTFILYGEVIFQIFWVHHFNQRVQVDKGAKVFNVADKFLVHVFKAHLRTMVCTVQSTSDIIDHEATEKWLRETAETLLADTLMPIQTGDPFHRLFLHLGLLYCDLRNALR